MTVRKLSTHPIHLGLGASAAPQPEFTGAMQWYDDYGQRHGADGAEGRLVTEHSFDVSWDSWEMHPHGSEVVFCTAGSITIVQELPDGSQNRVTIQAGQYVINEPGIWHTADVSEPATALFITAGMGTEHRPR